MGKKKKTILKKLGVIKRIRVRKREKKFTPTLTKNQELEKILASFEQTESDTESIEEKTTGLISFEHRITDMEFKLRYLNLKDVFDRDYGRSFPSLNSSLLIIDSEGRHFSAFKAGYNQVSGDLLSFFKVNGLRPGDVISVEYDRNELSGDGSYIVRIKSNKKVTPEDVQKEPKQRASKVKPAEGRVIRSDEETVTSPQIEDVAPSQIEMGQDEKDTDLILFEHRITDMEVKLKYLNLRDIDNKEYGRSFPSTNSELLIIDGDGRHFSAFKAGYNQVSGDLFSFFKVNGLRSGDVISVEYDRSEIADDGSHVMHIKTKK